jgi:hypothetical protein
MNDAGNALMLNQNQINPLNGVTDQVQGQYADVYGNIAPLSDSARFGRVQELNQQLSADWTKSAAPIFNADKRLAYQPLNQPSGGFVTVLAPNVQKQFNLTPDDVRNSRDNVGWSIQRYSVIVGAGPMDPMKGMAHDPYPVQPNFSQIR